MFLKYFMVFGDRSCFVDHTGFWTTQSYLYRQEQLYHKLIKAHKEAKDSMDIEKIWTIESGKYRIKDD